MSDRLHHRAIAASGRENCTTPRLGTSSRETAIPRSLSSISVRLFLRVVAAMSVRALAGCFRPWNRRRGLGGVRRQAVAFERRSPQCSLSAAPCCLRCWPALAVSSCRDLGVGLDRSRSTHTWPAYGCLGHCWVSLPCSSRSLQAHMRCRGCWRCVRDDGVSSPSGLQEGSPAPSTSRCPRRRQSASCATRRSITRLVHAGARDFISPAYDVSLWLARRGSGSF